MSVFKRYGLKGIVISIFVRALSFLGIKIHFYRLYSKHIEKHPESTTCPINKFVLLSFQEYATSIDENWGSKQKLESLKEYFKSSSEECWGVIKENVLISYGWISTDKYVNFPFSLPTNAGYLWDDYVNPKYRGKRLHREIIDLRCKKLNEKKISYAHTIIEIQNRSSIRSYERCGFSMIALIITIQITKYKMKYFRYERTK